LLADPIAGLRSSVGALITIFLDRPGPGGVAALLSDLLKPLREEAEQKGGVVRKSVRVDAERIHDLADRLEVDVAPAYAIFAADADDVFLVEPLTHTVPNVSSLGPRPYLRPLRAAPRPLRAGIIVGDRVSARIFVGSDELVEELAAYSVDIGKPNYGGFGGYEEHNVRAHADEESTRMWKEAGAGLLERHLDRPFDFLIVGGQEGTVEEIGRTLHPYLARLQRTTFAANPHTLTPAALRSNVLDLQREVRRQRESALAEHLVDTAKAGGLALLGLAQSLRACNAQAVETLVVAGSFTMPGVLCNQCGFLARAGDLCPVSGDPMFPVEDVVAAAMDATVGSGGTVHQIEVASPLDVDGVGVLTRFRVVA
jgi:peptide chain release factor subunit 1